MAPPPWVTESLGNILGLDAETINEVIVPDLESYSSEVRLRGHLLDFLGTTPAARAFADRYVSYRFPSIAPPAVTLTPDPDLAKPKKTKGDKDKKKSKSSQLGSASASASVTPSSSMSDMAALNAAFGPNGHVYQKRRDDELFPSRGGSGAGGHRSTPGSGAHTPARRGGAVTITEKASKSKGKERAPPQEEKIWDLPKSDEVKRLDGVIANLRALQVGDGKPPAVDTLPCFCQARVHPLAPYTPQCAACGLILCAKQPAHASCPSCARPTLGPPALARLIQRVEGDVDTQLEREQQERDDAERARKERLLAESGGGAFPSLQGKTGGKPASAADAARRVLSIKPAAKNGKGKGKSKAVLTTTTYLPHPTASVSAPAPPPPVDDTVPRPRSPPLDPNRIAKELAKAIAAREESDRPWYDPKAERRGETWAYVEPLHVELPGEEGTGRRRKAKKKGLGVDGRVVVGAAR